MIVCRKNIDCDVVVSNCQCLQQESLVKSCVWGTRSYSRHTVSNGPSCGTPWRHTVQKGSCLFVLCVVCLFRVLLWTRALWLWCRSFRWRGCAWGSCRSLSRLLFVLFVLKALRMPSFVRWGHQWMEEGSLVMKLRPSSGTGGGRKSEKRWVSIIRTRVLPVSHQKGWAEGIDLWEIMFMVMIILVSGVMMVCTILHVISRVI